MGREGPSDSFRFQLAEITENVLRASKKTQKISKSISNPLIVLNTQESRCLNQPTKKVYSQTFKLKKSFDHSSRLKSGVPLRATTCIERYMLGKS